MVAQSDMTDLHDTPALADLTPWFRRIDRLEAALRGEQECNKELEDRVERLERELQRGRR